MRGKPTIHYVARIGGGHLYHSLPEGANAALCGQVPGGGRGTRGKWSRYTRDSQDRIGVTCQKCQAAEPTPAADLSLTAVIERCTDGVRGTYPIPLPGGGNIIGDAPPLPPQPYLPDGEATKCDGNHGGSRCTDPECWNDGVETPDGEQR